MKAVAWVLGVAFLLFCIAWLNVDNIRNWFFPNNIEVRTYGDAKPELVKIDWTAEAFRDTLTLYDQGTAQDAEFRAGGYNYFLLYYKGKLLATFEQFKSNPVAGHNYNFMIWQNQDSVQVNLKIEGPEALL